MRSHRLLRCVVAVVVLATLGGGAAAALDGWRFQVPPAQHCGRDTECRWAAAYDAYAEWHNATRAAADCASLRAVVWSPNAGLGDSLLALLSGLQVALKTGRAFFVDWSAPADGWRLGLRLPGIGRTWGARQWDWDWPSFQCSGQAADRPAVAAVSGSITAAHWVLAEVAAVAAVWHDALHPHAHAPGADRVRDEFVNALPRRWYLAPQVLRPSAAVVDHVGLDTVLALNATFVVGLQVRTGHTHIVERTPFLSPGDEHLFFDCYRAFAARGQLAPGAHKVVVVSDNPGVRAAAAAELPADSLVTLPSAPIEHTRQRRRAAAPSVAGALSAWSDLFVLSLADVLFLTNWSLFGRAASEIGVGGRDTVVHYVSDSACGTPGHKACREPRLPAACAAVGHAEL